MRARQHSWHDIQNFPRGNLQNLLYEKRHYENEIRDCLSYHSAFSDADIELMPIDEFVAAVR